MRAAPGALLTVIVVVVCAPLAAVTTTVMVFEPTFRLIDPDADPDVTAVPFTVIEAPESVLVGVTVIELMLLATEAVYEVVLEEKVGERVPEERVRAERVELVDSHRALIVLDWDGE